jgi:nucleoid-associated protein YgaU
VATSAALAFALGADSARAEDPKRPTETGQRVKWEVEPAPGTAGAVPPVSAGAAAHVVEAGDTLAGIAERYLGSASEWERIARANGIDDPTKLAIGTRLSIPGADAAAPQAEPASAP